MTQDDIIRMAREAGLYVEPHRGGNWAVPLVPDLPERVERFAARVAAAKQEQIARQWDALHEQYMADPLRRQMMLSYEMVARMIRGGGG